MKTLKEAALQVLGEKGPMHYQQLTEEMLSRGLTTSTSKTPGASLNAVLAVDIKSKGSESKFVRVGPGVFSLRGVADGTDAIAEPTGIPEEGEEAVMERRVRTPLFPAYAEVRPLLRVWPGRPRKQITGFRSTVGELQGTPQNTVDWSDPDVWIPERLTGGDLELAAAMAQH